MAKTRMMVKQVLMSIVTLVSFVMAQYEDKAGAHEHRYPGEFRNGTV